MISSGSAKNLSHADLVVSVVNAVAVPLFIAIVVVANGVVVTDDSGSFDSFNLDAFVALDDLRDLDDFDVL